MANTIEFSLHVLLQLRDIGAQLAAQLDDLISRIESQVDFDHTPYADYQPPSTD